MMSKTAGPGEALPVLALESVRLMPGEAPGAELLLDLVLHPQDLVLVDAGGETRERLIVDAVCGLVSPQSGRVFFLGRGWEGLPPDHASALRGRIGQGFGAGAWIPYLSLADNIVLGQLFHTRRPEAAFLSEASRLAYRFGLPGLPSDLVGGFSAADLQRAALVRAFVGTPALVILESQRERLPDGLPPDLRARLIDAVFGARERGAAILWFTSATDLLFDATIPATARYRLLDGELVPTEGIV